MLSHRQPKDDALTNCVRYLTHALNQVFRDLSIFCSSVVMAYRNITKDAQRDKVTEMLHLFECSEEKTISRDHNYDAGGQVLR